MTLTTRRPTGIAPWPLVLVDGPAKCGSTTFALELSASDRVGRTFVFQVGERAADTYANLGRFEIVELDGSWHGFITALRAAAAVPQEDGKPNVIIIDTITMVWFGLKLWAQRRACNSRAARRILADDPDALIDVSMNYWNDAKSRWGEMLAVLKSWNGIAVLIARGADVTAVEDGSPVRGETVYRVDAEKNTLGNVTDRITFPGRFTPVVDTTSGVTVDLSQGPLPLPVRDGLAYYLFDVLAVDAATRSTQGTVGADPGIPAAHAKNELVAVFKQAPGFSEDDSKAAAAAIWKARYPDPIPEIPQSVLDEFLAAAHTQIDAPAPTAAPSAPANPGVEVDLSDDALAVATLVVVTCPDCDGEAVGADDGSLCERCGGEGTVAVPIGELAAVDLAEPDEPAPVDVPMEPAVEPVGGKSVEEAAAFLKHITKARAAARSGRQRPAEDTGEAPAASDPEEPSTAGGPTGP